MHKREQIFQQLKLSQGKKVIHHPCWFRFALPDVGAIEYLPDFYCPDEDIYYEVVGTKQAYKQNLCKYLLMRKFYPHIKFHLVNPRGIPYRAAILRTGKKRGVSHPLSQYLSDNFLTAIDFAKRANIDKAWISRIINRVHKVRTTTAEKISQATGGKVSISDFDIYHQ